MTQVIASIKDWRELRKQFDSSCSVGFVPTMGNLHEGHASLLNYSRRENDISVLSIFVNPTQFNDKKDLENYPRTQEADLELARALKVDYALLPSSTEIYPDEYVYKITESQVSHTLEGQYRPGHFEGVLTVVMKLFSLVKPHRAYFGEKDYQQLYLIKEMVKAFFLEIEIKACPTRRRESGFALSSRNNLMTADELALADEIAQILHAHDDLEVLHAELAQRNIPVDYLKKLEDRLLWAIRIGSVRVLDNREIKKPDLLCA